MQELSGQKESRFEKEELIVAFSHGLGNQMFQYAVARRLQIEYGAKIICDLSKFSYRGSDATKRAYCLDQFDLSSDIIL